MDSTYSVTCLVFDLLLPSDHNRVINEDSKPTIRCFFYPPPTVLEELLISVMQRGQMTSIPGQFAPQNWVVIVAPDQMDSRTKGQRHSRTEGQGTVG